MTPADSEADTLPVEGEAIGSTPFWGAAKPNACEKRCGRPRGSDYRHVDAPLHEEMRQLLERGEVPSRSAAARKVAMRAYGAGTKEESKIARLVRTYPLRSCANIVGGADG